VSDDIVETQVGGPGDKQEDKENKNIRLAKAKQAGLVLLTVCLTVVLLHQLGYLKFPWERGPRMIMAGDLFPGLGDAVDGHLATMTREQILAQMQRVVDESQFSFKINARPVFASGNAGGNLDIENPSYNMYPMVVQITLDDSEEVIYDSGGILPNQHIANARLNRALNAGTYRATASMNAYDPVTKIWQGRALAALIITVES
jgi:hypothetical protein